MHWCQIKRHGRCPVSAKKLKRDKSNPHPPFAASTSPGVARWTVADKASKTLHPEIRNRCPPWSTVMQLSGPPRRIETSADCRLLGNLGSIGLAQRGKWGQQRSACDRNARSIRRQQAARPPGALSRGAPDRCRRCQEAPGPPQPAVVKGLARPLAGSSGSDRPAASGDRQGAIAAATRLATTTIVSAVRSRTNQPGTDSWRG